MRPRTLLWLALVTLGLGASLARAGSASIFTKQTENTGNTFTTAASFATDTPTATPTSTPTATPTATPSPSCTAGDTGLLNPSAQAADTGGSGDGFETDPTYAFADDALYALNVNGPGDRHLYYDYSISIPSGCSVKGIEVRLDWWLDSTEGTNSMSVELSWDGDTSWTTAKTDTTATTSEHTATLGGPEDAWGYAWTVAELSDANFRVRLTSNSDSSDRDFFLDWVPVRVYYGADAGARADFAAFTRRPSATPAPTPAITPTPIAPPTATLTPTPAITPTPIAPPTARPTPTPAAKATPTAPLTATPTPAPSCTAMPTPTVTPTPAPSCTDMPTPIVTPTPTATPTPS